MTALSELVSTRASSRPMLQQLTLMKMRKTTSMTSGKRFWMRYQYMAYAWSQVTGCKSGEQHVAEEGTVGKFDVTGERSDNKERFVSLLTLQ